MTQAIFAPITRTPELQSQYYVGLPPEMTGGDDLRVPMPIPRVVIAAEGERRGWVLYRYTSDRKFAGETWHPSMPDAKEQAAQEFNEALGKWREIPEGVDDILSYALQQSA
jgi:hypothetical protein